MSPTRFLCATELLFYVLKCYFINFKIKQQDSHAHFLAALDNLRRLGHGTHSTAPPPPEQTKTRRRRNCSHMRAQGTHQSTRHHHPKIRTTTDWLSGTNNNDATTATVQRRLLSQPACRAPRRRKSRGSLGRSKMVP